MAHNFTMEAFYNICDALEVEPEDLIKASVFPDKLIKKN